MFKHSLHSGFSFYDNELSGQPIVFVHGLAASAHYGDFLIKAFPKSRVVLVELPSHGKAPEHPNTIDLALMAQELILVLQQKGIDKPVMSGHSLGGQICLLAEIMHPGYARKMILIAPAGLEPFTKTEIQIIFASLNLTSVFMPIQAPAYTSTVLKQDHQLLSSKVAEAYISSMLSRPVDDLLHMITCEVQVYIGDGDLLIPNRMFRMESAVSYLKRILKDVPNFKLHILHGAGHWPMLENAGGLIKILQENNLDLK